MCLCVCVFVCLWARPLELTILKHIDHLLTAAGHKRGNDAQIASQEWVRCGVTVLSLTARVWGCTQIASGPLLTSGGPNVPGRRCRYLTYPIYRHTCGVME